MHYKAQTSKVRKNKLIQAKQDTQTCYVKIIWPTLISNPRKIMQNTFVFPFPSFFFIIFFKKYQKNPSMKCMNVMQCKS